MCSTALDSSFVTAVYRMLDFFVVKNLQGSMVLIHQDALAHQSTQAPTVSAGITVTLIPAEMVAQA